MQFNKKKNQNIKSTQYNKKIYTYPFKCSKIYISIIFIHTYMSWCAIGARIPDTIGVV